LRHNSAYSKRQLSHPPLVEDFGSGLGLTVTRQGDEKTFPKAGDELKLHYVGTLAKGGVQFDSSRDRGQPFTVAIGVGKVIRGWDEGVTRMSLGERGVLHVPAAKAYGTAGAGDGKIPPNADLDFDIELLAINGKELETPAAPEQGFNGKDVKHEDMKTVTSDWRSEYRTTTVPTEAPKKSYTVRCAWPVAAVGIIAAQLLL